VAIDSAAATADASMPVTFATLVLDFVGHRATLAGSEIDLSRRLRRKLGDLGACVETVWGIGYRFRPELREAT
jgi:DNA-binding response OmpR family regulator